MHSRVIVLLNDEQRADPAIDWERIGTVVTELSELYRIVKEQRVNLILAAANRNDMKRPVLTRIRRWNGLTEIWLVGNGSGPVEYDSELIDGSIAAGLSTDGLLDKVAQILHGSELLASQGMVGRSSRMKAVAATIKRIAPADVAVLIVGGSGSGKELVASAIHNNSLRAKAPYVTVNCGALAEGVLESELFGHEKGAFTGSVGKRDGLFRAADSGTIFLDEIGEMPPQTQVRLLRVLEDGTFYSVGSSIASSTNVRVLSATNIDLTEAIADRQFREDLYYRIGVVKIVLPPLLERRGDIQPLLQHFWKDSPDIDCTDSALEKLMRYDWPGNVRQLKNFADKMAALKQGGLVEVEDVERFVSEQAIHATNLPVATGKSVEEAGQELIYRAIVSLGNEIRLLRDLITSHLPSREVGSVADRSIDPDDSESSINAMEDELIRRVLHETGGNRKQAARKLGIGERTLYRKLKKYRIG
ncbi:MAG: sigma-54 interaction domain-containing protein [Candidatus Zixiibacteriota bacterium]